MYQTIIDFLTDDRLLSNLIALHGAVGLLLIVSIILRRILTDGSAWLVKWTGLHWLDDLSQEASRKGRAVIFWTTLGLMGLMVVSAIGYHTLGRDIRSDLAHWYQAMTAEQMVLMVWGLVQLVVLVVGMLFTSKIIRQLREYMEVRARTFLPEPAASEPTAEPSPESASQERAGETVSHWFFLLERFLKGSVFLLGIWCAGHILHLGTRVDVVVGFLLRLMSILMVARLLTLACRTLSHGLETLGNRHLSEGQFFRYWQRVTRLFPFGERCFEAMVYISAASLVIYELEFIKEVARYGPKIVGCIGIFLTTRIFIELLTVLLNEAFGLYREHRPTDQKGLTLVPLLQSISQYVLYFGSVLAMMSVLGIPTAPVLASVSVVGLALGLGAQSLVTDFVSGFFILFENQFLVGDIVQIGDAAGRVEAVSIRHTQIRDEQGKLYIIPNGQIKSVINYSKGFVNAVVDIKVPTSTHLDSIMKEMAEAGRRLRQARREVLGETVIKGLVDLTPGDMTIRAVTKVMPGTHGLMQNEFRRLLKEVFDERNKTPSLAA